MDNISKHSRLEMYAAILEADQADRDYSEAYVANRDNGFRWASEEDYAMWSVAGYAASARTLSERLMYKL